MINILKPDFEFHDERGTLFQLIHGNCNQVNYVESQPNSVRGGHYHKLNKEIFYVIEGVFTVTAELNGNRETMSFKTGDMFSIDAYVIHSFEYKEFSRLIVMYDKGIELPNSQKDIYNG
jgi:mannose-6-phosphate isomerase-like protein (cupin superfamily)